MFYNLSWSCVSTPKTITKRKLHHILKFKSLGHVSKYKEDLEWNMKLFIYIHIIKEVIKDSKILE